VHSFFSRATAVRVDALAAISAVRRRPSAGRTSSHGRLRIPFEILASGTRPCRVDFPGGGGRPVVDGPVDDRKKLPRLQEPRREWLHILASIGTIDP